MKKDFIDISVYRSLYLALGEIISYEISIKVNTENILKQYLAIVHRYLFKNVSLTITFVSASCFLHPKDLINKYKVFFTQGQNLDYYFTFHLKTIWD